MSEIEVGTRRPGHRRTAVRSGLLLPQVATDYGWDRETFLEHTCAKAGLPSEPGSSDGVTILKFTAEVFGEERRARNELGRDVGRCPAALAAATRSRRGASVSLGLARRRRRPARARLRVPACASLLGDASRASWVQVPPLSQEVRRAAGRPRPLRGAREQRRHLLHAHLRQSLRRPRRPDREEALLPLPARRPPRSRSPRPGCNLDCKFCQNWHISQARPEELANYRPAAEPTSSRPRRERQPVHRLHVLGADDLLRVHARRARSSLAPAGLRNVYHSNGFINEEPSARALPVPRRGQHRPQGLHRRVLPRHDRRLARARPALAPRSCRRRASTWRSRRSSCPAGTTTPRCSRTMCRWIRDNLGASVPLHFSRFHPQYRLTDLPPTPVETLERARSIALERGAPVRLHRERAGTRGEQHLLPRVLGRTHPQDRLLGGSTGPGERAVL